MMLRVTSAWRACILVITDDAIPIDLKARAEPLGTIGIRMAILRAACVLIRRPVDSAAVLVFNFSTREHELSVLSVPHGFHGKLLLQMTLFRFTLPSVHSGVVHAPLI